jgi:hypothetical protein
VGANFTVGLDELEAVRAKLRALIQDHFETPSSPLANATYHDNTASDVSQSELSGDIRQAAGNDGGSNFGPTDTGLDAAAVLDEASGQAQQAIYALLAEVNQKIKDLHDRIQQTHRAYTTTEQNLRMDVAQVQRNVG